MTKHGPAKHVLILDIEAHAKEQCAQSDFAHKQDWSDPSCDKCYLGWLHKVQSRDSWACSGNPEREVCVDYGPPVLPEIQAQNMQAFRQFNNVLVDKGVLDESKRTYDN